jgi:GNAT superfamily N-acetyltransferase
MNIQVLVDPLQDEPEDLRTFEVKVQRFDGLRLATTKLTIHKEDGTGYVHGLEVLEEHQGKGYATMAMGSAGTFSREQHLKVIYLITYHQRLYERMGWQAIFFGALPEWIRVFGSVPAILAAHKFDPSRFATMERRLL